jgi:hypothetical protein
MSVSIVGITAAAAVVGAGATIYSASKASSASNKAIDAQKASASGELGLAQEQWDFQKNVYLPKSMELAQKNADLTEKVANQQLSDSAYYRGLSGELTDQAKKSWKYQDQYMAMTDKYASGEMGNTMANEANADVQQAGAAQRGITERALERRGVNPGSGAGLALYADDQVAQAAAGAGAQTTARKMARDKAEQMVGIAAGAGNAGFGTGLSAGGLATGAGTAATGASAAGLAGYNGVNSAYTAGTSAAGANFSRAGNTGANLAASYAGSPFADAISGIFTGLSKSGTGLSSFHPPYSGAGGGDGGFGGTFDAYANGVYPD